MPNLEPIAISMAEAAHLLSVSRQTVYTWSKTKGFPAVKLGGCTRVLVDDLREWAKMQGRAD